MDLEKDPRNSGQVCCDHRHLVQEHTQSQGVARRFGSALQDHVFRGFDTWVVQSGMNRRAMGLETRNWDEERNGVICHETKLGAWLILSDLCRADGARDRPWGSVVY